jgi:nucleoside-diphosphate-sugar epimerase
MRILISGATGFIGRHLTEFLAARHEVFAVTRQEPPSQAPPGTHWVFQDLTQPLDLASLPARIDAVIHLAQSKFYRQFPEGARDVFGVNVYGTFQLLEYAREAHAQSFIQASSGGVYGYSYERFTETNPANPLNFYLSSKYAAELLTANYQRFFRTVVLRFFFVYGPGQTRMLVPNLLRKVRNGERILVEGNPGLRINPIYIGDAVRVFEPALHLESSALFNVAGDEVVSITDLLSAIERATGEKAVIQYTDSRQEGDLIGDNSRMKAVLGVHPSTSILEGVQRML